MRSLRLSASIAVAIVALGTAVAGGVVATTMSSDEAALEPARQSADRGIELRRRPAARGA